MEQINLNLIPGSTMPVVHASQYDIGRTIRFNLFEGSEVFAFASGDTAEVHVRKPDGNVVTKALTVAASQTYVDVVTTQQMDAVAGSNLGEIEIKRTGVTLGTLNFILEVEPDPMDGGVRSQSSIYDLQAQVDGFVENSINGSTVVIDKAALIAQGREYTNSAVRADHTYIGNNISSAIINNSAGSMVYKIDIENAATITYPLFKSSQNNGCAVTDSAGMVLRGYFNSVEDTGTLATINVADLPTAKYFYFGTNAALEGMTFSITLNNKSVTYDVDHKVDALIENNDLIDSADLFTQWVQGNENPAGGHSVSTTRCHSHPIIYAGDYTDIRVLANGKKIRITFYNSFGTRNSSTLIATASNTSWTNGELSFKIPDTTKSFVISVAYVNDATITPSDCGNIYATVYKNNIINEFQNSVISLLGDSITTFAGDNPSSAGDGHTIADGVYTYAGNHCRYPNTYLSNVNQTYWKMLIDTLDMKLGINDSWAGSRVSWNGTESSDQGADIYIASPTRIGHLDDNGTPDFILVNAGTNDIGGNVTVGTFNTESPVNYTDAQIAALPVATFADAFRALLIRLQKSYPLARIVVMLPNYTTSYYDPTKADAYLEIIKEACDYFGVPYIDMRTTGITMFNTGTYTGDGIHPNPSGMILLFEKLFKFFKNSL